MKIIKVSNLFTNGKADYKGLDLDKIVGGTQLYPKDDNVAYFYYEGDVTGNEEITIIDQAMYEEKKQSIVDEASNTMTTEKEIEQLKQQNKELSLATLELADTVAAQDALLREQQAALLDLANTLAEVTANGYF